MDAHSTRVMMMLFLSPKRYEILTTVSIVMSNSLASV
jgi:hypothetical protein